MAPWNARRALGTPGTPEGPWNCPKGYFVLFVGRRYYLRPNPLRSPPLRPLERAKRYWNAPPASWNARRGFVKNHYYTRATHGIVEAMWSNRGAFVERGFLSGVPENLGFWGEEEKRCKSQTRDETFVSYALSDDSLPHLIRNPI